LTRNIQVNLDDVIEAIECSSEGSVAYFDTWTGRVEVMDDQMRSLVRADTPLDELPDWQHPLVEVGRLIEAEKDARFEVEATEDAERRFLPLPDPFDVHEWRVMAEFAEGQADAKVGRQLLDTLRGRGAFRRFKDTAHRLGVIDAWYAARDAAYRREAVNWCQANGLTWAAADGAPAG
jgi:hypothetical protein